MKRRAITRSLAIVITVISANASTADVSVESAAPGRLTSIFVNGALSWDEADQFIRKVEAVSNGVVYFNSKGGDLLAALIIGQTIRQKKFATAVKRDGLCESVCGLAWLGGVERFLEPPMRIGFRAASDDWEPGKASLGAYLNEMRLSASAQNFITDPPQGGMNRLDRAQAEKLGIIMSVWPNAASPATPPKPPDVAAESLWSHNNSTLSLTIDGVQWKFYYETPSPETAAIGIRRGTLFFVGQKKGRGYRGIRIAFSTRCGGTPYLVRGEMSENGQNIWLRGNAPALDERCRILATWESTALLVRGEPQSSDPVSSIPLPR